MVMISMDLKQIIANILIAQTYSDDITYFKIRRRT